MLALHKCKNICVKCWMGRAGGGCERKKEQRQQKGFLPIYCIFCSDCPSPAYRCLICIIFPTLYGVVFNSLCIWNKNEKKLCSYVLYLVTQETHDMYFHIWSTLNNLLLTEAFRLFFGQCNDGEILHNKNQSTANAHSLKQINLLFKKAMKTASIPWMPSI